MLEKGDIGLSEGSDNEKEAVLPFDGRVDVASLDAEPTEEAEEMRRLLKRKKKKLLEEGHLNFLVLFWFGKSADFDSSCRFAGKYHQESEARKASSHRRLLSPREYFGKYFPLLFWKEVLKQTNL